MRHVAIFNVRSQWEDPESLLLFFVLRVYYEKLGHILKPIVPTFRPNLFARLGNIAEKQVPANLKPIVYYQFVLFVVLVCSALVIISDFRMR